MANATTTTAEPPTHNPGWNPRADDRAMVLCPHPDGSAARFTVLTDRLVRMEWSPTAQFEDRASQAFVNRRLEVPRFAVERHGLRTTIDTGALRVFFSQDGKPFNRANLSVEFTLEGVRRTWKPGDVDRANLGGTTRTLDGVDGACPVEPGLLSRDGWVVIDDTTRLVFEPGSGAVSGPRGWDWLVARDAPRGQIDWWFFGYGRDYSTALHDFARAAGRIPMPPRYVFGSWWSRYWAYTDAELRTLVSEFRRHDVPVDVLVIDMDWHLDGWTGYTWNRDCFPDPQSFLTWARGEGLMISLNLHPADGVGKHEDAFEPVARALGLDPAAVDRIPFDCTSPAFVDAYFRHLHWPLEKQGIDFWWMDWQQGTQTNVPGLDPLWWLNHLHWEDLRWRQNPANDETNLRVGKRPLVFSRWGGLGNHRYPIGFSGDTYSTWASLAWQPRFTAMAGQVGYAYWSHDIGGHQPGPVEPELYARWVQFGALSPVLRTHTSKNPQGERRIWASPAREFRAMREAFLLRYALLPYTYTSARACYDTAMPLCRPLYLHWPHEARAYENPGQYLFGPDLLAAPVTARADRTSRAAAWSVWLPPLPANGRWTNWFTGESLAGGTDAFALVPIDEAPLWASEGAIIPMAPAMRHSRERPLDPLILRVFPGDRGSTRLYEDDGESGGYEQGQCAWTPVSFEQRGRTLVVRIGPAEGSFPGMLEERSYEVRLSDRWPAASVRLNAGDLPAGEGAGSWSYDRQDLAIIVRTGPRSVREGLEIEVTLSERDDGALRRGLRGRARMLRSVASVLGERCPEHIASVVGLTSASMPDPEFATALESAVAGADNWTLARAAAACGADPGAVHETVCRLLGVSCVLEFTTEGLAPGEIVTRARATVPRGQGLDARVDIPGAGAEHGRWERLSRREFADGPLTVVEARWRTPSVLQQTTVRAEVKISGPGAGPIVLPFVESVLPSINGWWVIGPFHEKFSPIQLGRQFGPETDASLTRRHDDGRGGTIGWQRIDRALKPGDDPQREFFVDLHAAFGQRADDAIAYALSFIEADHDAHAVLALGSDDGVAAWLNGTEVHRNQVSRGYGSRQDRVPVRLQRGLNTLLLKISQDRGAWGFGAHIETAEGLAVPATRVVRGD